jgi:fucose 4-O-acetylase-like acetyltransferase
LLAVPVFFSISLFLFYKHQSTEENFSFKKRLENLFFLYGVWMFVGILINSLLTKGKYILELINIKRFLIMIVTGSRGELFFLFSLIFISCLAFINSKYLLSNKNSFLTQLFLLFWSLLILWLVSFSTVITNRTIFSAYWNPVCFIPYIFSSSILVLVNEQPKFGLVTFLQRKRLSFILLLFSTFLLLSWLEWRNFNIPSAFGGYLLPPYARASLVIGAFVACYCAILYKRKPPNLIQDLSQESLGIYLLHGYFLFLIGFSINKIQIFQLPLKIIFNPISRVIFAVLISVFISKVLKQYKIGRAILGSRSK